MPFSSSRIPSPGGPKPSKSSFLPSPNTATRSRTSGIAQPRAATKSPVQFQRPVKRLQFPPSHEATNQDETQVNLSNKAQAPTPPRVPRSRQLTRTTSFVPLTDPAAQSDNIRVLLRIRPSPGKETKRCLEVAPDQRGVTLAPLSQQEKRFGFDRVFTETCEQDDIFQDAGRVAVENTIEGYNGSIFAYGQTGSGKTFTMLGGATTNAHELRLSPLRGLTPRIIDYLFQRLAALARERNEAFYKGEEDERALQYTLACSYLEIYNEKVFDLLEPTGSVAAQQPKSLREDSNKAVYVDQLREIDVGSEEEALTLLQLGSQNRHISSTEMNRESSRSHAVFSVKLVLEERTSAGVKRTRRSCLHLVDLAGSEKQRQTRVHGKRLKEAAQINKSLSALGNVIMALVDVSNGQKRHVHYRDSKLTFLLRDALGGNAITSIVATISPEEKYFTETLSTLKFAQRAKFIKNNAVQNEDAESLVPVLKQQIEKLLEEIASLRSSAGSGLSPTASLTASSKDEHMMRIKPIAEADAETRCQEKKSENKWEPALDMMQKLLRASGAAACADMAEGEAMELQQQERSVVEVRCDRLEMLLYRMICRFEEYKEVTFDPDRYKYNRRSTQLKPGKLQGPRMSMLPAPKRYNGAAVRYHNEEHCADNDKSAAALAAAEKRECELSKKVQDQQSRIEELLQRCQEAEAENDLIRHELCELLEWKAFVEEERRRVSDAVPMDLQQDSEDEHETPILEASIVPSEEMQEMQEMLNVYRSLFDEVTELMDTKKPILCSPPSPKSGSSVVTDSNSTSYASGDEDDIGDDCVSVDGYAASEDGERGISDAYREIRRVSALSSRLGRKLDLYQDTIQRLEKELQTTQDELETSSAATKFAEFQLRQLRTLASDEEDKQSQMEHELRKKVDALEETVRGLQTKQQRALLVTKDDQTSEKAKEGSKSDELMQSKRELAILSSEADDLTDLSVPGVDDKDLAKSNDIIQRLTLERTTLRGRLHRAQETATRLETELRRVYQNAAVDRSNCALSTEFLCGN